MKKEDRELVGHLHYVATEVAKQEKLSDFRVVINNGAGAGQTVFHLHLHLLGGRRLDWPPG
jgi:histidine triad (HIT) family protein